LRGETEGNIDNSLTILTFSGPCLNLGLLLVKGELDLRPASLNTMRRKRDDEEDRRGIKINEERKE
jgi:hypothetical protein